MNNLSSSELLQEAVNNCEGIIGNGEALLVSTGKYTGRATDAKRIVRTPTNNDDVWWDNNKYISMDDFIELKAEFYANLYGKKTYTQELRCGKGQGFNVNVETTKAWHSLFIRNLLNVPEDLTDFTSDITVLCIPEFHETIIAIDIENCEVLIGGTEYAGEIKKSIFTIANYHYPTQDVFPMHCAANVSTTDPEDVAIFFGLSGTGKTTLSSSPNRILIGDDEHGWGKDGVFNFEGGCYAKTQGLSLASEPEIYKASKMHGSIVENMVFKLGKDEVDYNDDSLTPNSRCSYPLSSLTNVSSKDTHPHPNNIFMLSYDGYGVLPPIAKLSADEAVRWFLLGYTSKVAGTEQGINTPTVAFSTCFGAPFMPRKPATYGTMLKERILNYSPNIWLVNTGIIGGLGKRIPLMSTRKILEKALEGKYIEFTYDEDFKFKVPKGLEATNYWSNNKDYMSAKNQLLSIL